MPSLAASEILIIVVFIGIPVLAVGGLIVWLLRTELTLRQLRKLVVGRPALPPEDRSEPAGWVTPDTELPPSPTPPRSPSEPQQSPYDQPSR